MTCPDTEGHPLPGGHRETKAHPGSQTQRGSVGHRGSQDHQETRAHLGSVATRGSVAHWDSVVSQDHRETKAHRGLGANQSFPGDHDRQDQPEPRGGSAGLLDLEVSQGSTPSQGSEDHLGTQVSQVFVTLLGSVSSQPSQDHLENKVPQGSVATRGSVGNQDPLEPNVDEGSMIPLDSKGNQGSRARLDLKVHPESVPSQASEHPQEPQVHQDPVANQSPMAPVEVSEDPVSCLDLRVYQDPVANQAPQDPQEPRASQDPTDHPETQDSRDPVALTDWKVHQDPMANHSPVDPRDTSRGSRACLDLRVPQDAVANEGCTPRPGTESHRPPPPTWATPAPRPCPHISSGARLGLVLLTLGSLLLPCARGSALEFGGAPGQWARYGRWAPGAGGQLSFRLKTNVTRALLLYLDDGGNCDFLELLVAEGRLRLRFAIACAEPATLEPPAPVSDGRWHAVLLTRHARHAALAVDGE
ncbi:NRX2A protein, partial [Smithornis capensis]|nr:NRX2A protein [Smithornis capensis]